MRNAYLILIFFLSLLNYSARADAIIDSLQHALLQIDSITNGDQWLFTSLTLAQAQANNTQYEEALQRFQQITHTTLTTNPEILLKAQLGIGEIYYAQGHYEQAISVLKTIYSEENETKPYSDIIGEARRLAAMCHVFLGNYTNAYSLQITALQTFSKLGDSLKIARLNYDIANTYFYQEQYQVALDYFQKALKIYDYQHNTKGLFRCYAAMGSVYGYLNQFDQSVIFNQKGLTNARKNGDKQDIGWALLNVGANYYDDKKYDLALQHLLEGLQLSRETKNERLESNILVTISRVYADTKKFDLSIDYLHQGLDITQKSNDRSNIREIYKWFAETYYEKGDLAKYHQYIDRYIAIKDTLYNEEVIAQMNNMQKSFELQNAEREKQIALLKKNEEIQKLKENSLIGGSILGLLVLSLFLILMYNRNRNQNALNQLLAIKNEEILKQNQRLEASNRDLEQFAYIISHDLKEPLRNISGFTTLLKRRCNHYQDEEALEYMGFVFNSVNQMHQLLNDILTYSKINSKNKEQQLVNANSIVNNAINNLQHRIQEEKAVIKVDILPEVKANPSQLLQVFQNLISNALKFKSEHPPIIEINCLPRTKDHLFSIRDNGVGIECAYFDKIFIPFQRLNNRSEYEGSGIGLSTCKKIIEEYGGKIWVESQFGIGTVFYFTLPNLSQPVITHGVPSVVSDF